MGTKKMAKTNIGIMAPYALSGLLGLLLGTAITSVALSNKATPLLQSLNEKENRIQLLSGKLQEQTDYFESLSETPNESTTPIGPEQMQVQPTPPDQKTAQPTPPPRPAPRLIPNKSAQEPQIKVPADPDIRVRAETPEHDPKTSPISKTNKPSQPPSTEGKKIEAVSSGQAGVGKIEKGAITLDSGLRIRIGEKFPSGEELIYIDVPNQHIITNKRQILLMN
jgi:hypothetical protein